MLENGPRGLDHENLVERVNQEIQRAPLAPPPHLNGVVCELEGFVIPPALEERLEERLRGIHGVDLVSRNMAVRRLVWQTALGICQDIAAVLGYEF